MGRADFELPLEDFRLFREFPADCDQGFFGLFILCLSTDFIEPNGNIPKISADSDLHDPPLWPAVWVLDHLLQIKIEIDLSRQPRHSGNLLLARNFGCNLVPSPNRARGHPDFVAGATLVQIQAQVVPGVDFGKARVRFSVVNELAAGFGSKATSTYEFLKSPLLRHLRSPTVDV